MAKFVIGQTIRTTGLNEEVTVLGIRTNKGHTWYRLSDGTTLHERYLWSGIPDQKAFCSQLMCQRAIDKNTMQEGVHWVKDEYGNPMCKRHEIEYGYEQ